MTAKCAQEEFAVLLSSAMPVEDERAGWRPPLGSGQRILAGPEAISDMCLWLSRPAESVGPYAWPLLLVPETIDMAFELPHDALVTYQRVSWSEEPFRVEEPTELVTRLGWCRPEHGGTEIAILAEAHAGGRVAASNLLVARTCQGGLAERMGSEAVPKPPTTPRGERREAVTIGERDVVELSGVLGVHYPLHTSASAARHAGFSGILVYTTLLLLVQMRLAQLGSAGSIETWYPRPITAGTSLRFWASADGDCWECRTPGRDDPAVIARLGRHRP